MEMVEETLTLGRHLAHWRQAKQWTIGQLAIYAGVSKSSLSRWEAGLVQPRVRELEAVLEALRLSEVERRIAFSCIGAVRAAKRMIDRPVAAAVPASTGNHRYIDLPRTGNLLRALRVRAGYTQSEVAARLEINQSSVARWEASAGAPTREHIEALCHLLKATPQEVEALQEWPFLRPAFGKRITRDEAEERHQRLSRGAVFGAWNDADLAFFQLETDLWPSAQKYLPNRQLLIQVYASHACFLSWRGRHAEATRYLDLLRNGSGDGDLTHRGFPTAMQTGLLLETEPMVRSDLNSVKARIHRLISHHARITDPEHRSWLFFRLAQYHALLGRPDEARTFCAKGMAIPIRNGDNRAEEPAALLFRSAIFNQIEDYQGALAGAEGAMNATLTPAQTTLVEVVRATAFAGLGETASASDAIRTGYGLIRRFGTTSYRTALDVVAAAL